MLLDVNTKRGQKSLAFEKEMLKRIEYNFSVDGIIVKDNQLSGIFESKCRNMNFMEFNNYGSWLVTFDKIMDGKKISQMFRVPFFGFLYLIPDKIIYYWKITDEIGEFKFRFEVNKTTTQKTINGGKAVRTNAYLPIKYENEIT